MRSRWYESPGHEKQQDSSTALGLLHFWFGRVRTEEPYLRSLNSFEAARGNTKQIFSDTETTEKTPHRYLFGPRQVNCHPCGCFNMQQVELSSKSTLGV